MLPLAMYDMLTPTSVSTNISHFLTHPYHIDTPISAIDIYFYLVAIWVVNYNISRYQLSTIRVDCGSYFLVGVSLIATVQGAIPIINF